MHRRQVLAVVATASGLAGCVGDPLDSGDGHESQTPRPTEIRSWTHSTSVSVDDSVSASGEPVFEVDRDESAVTVEGVAAYGSSACGSLSFPEPAYDADESRLHVRVVDEFEEPDTGGCGDDLAGRSYRIVVWFDEGLPAEVVAEETEFSIRATRTIE